MNYLKVIIVIILTVFLGALALILLYQIATNRISLRYLISDDGGYASLSRFQFLVFTFVIAMTLFYLVAVDGKYPQIPNQILALLGISGGSYVISKGIQTTRDVGVAEATKQPPTESTPNDE